LATAIRFARMGKKKRPFYRLVAVDSRKRRDGAYLANLGFYNPFVEPYELQLHDEEIMVWLKRGAVVSETVRSLLKAHGLMLRFALEKQGMSAEDVSAKVAEFRASADVRAQGRADSTARRKSELVAEGVRVKAEAAAAKAAEAAAAAAAEKAAAAAEAAEAEAAEKAAAAAEAAEKAAAAAEATEKAAAEAAPAEGDGAA
jgi:small subunit ribosomal protein S16